MNIKQLSRNTLGVIAGLLVILAHTGCGPQGGQQTFDPLPDEPEVDIAIAHLRPTEGHEAHGTVTFTREENGIRVVAEVFGLDPSVPNRGFHIHEYGDCGAPDASSAGGHFNPTGMPHGGPADATRHAGDFGNITVGPDGVARADFIDTHISFSGPNSILQRSVIIHAQEDDLETQPTGDAGDRVACGVIMPIEE